MARMTLTPGFDYGNYHVRSLLGVGAMAEVYLATDTRSGLDVALKVLPRGIVGADARLQRFEREARAITATNHPNVVAIYEVGRHNRTPYIAMEYVDGVTLTEHLAAGRMSPHETLHLARQLSEGLQEAHSHGIVHRDLKPDNVMVTSDGVVKILDFGLSKPLASEKSKTVGGTSTSETCEELTLPGTILGTLEYMSPEQASGYRVDIRADQFAFGAIVYEMLTGEVAFRRDTAARVLAAVIEGEPAALSEETPQALRTVVERCLRKNPEERFQSTDALLAALKGADSNLRVEASPTSWLAAGGVVLAALAAALFI